MESGKDYWEKRYKDNQTQWDIGYVSTPLKEYIDQLNDKRIKILIPGCGNAYEGEYLLRSGFENVYLIDISDSALEQFNKRVPEFSKSNLICGDFFEHNDRYDLILEQTFFCALNPNKRGEYAKKVCELLRPGGKLVGVLFDDDTLNRENPPFGGDKEEYLTYFEPYFHTRVFERSYNSIPPRENRELFIILEKRKVN